MPYYTATINDLRKSPPVIAALAAVLTANANGALRVRPAGNVVNTALPSRRETARPLSCCGG